MKGGNFATERGEIMEVAMWLCTSLPIGLWSSLDLVPNYVTLVLGHLMLVLSNEGGSPHHMQSCRTHDLGVNLRKLSSFYHEYSSNIQLELHFLYTYV